MKKIINILTITALIISAPILAADHIKAYKGNHGIALMIESNDHRTFIIFGGAIPNGSATAAGCLAKINLTKHETPNYFEGNLSPTNNKISNTDESDIESKLGGLYILKNKIQVGGIDTSGICADGIDFHGNYNELKTEDKQYTNTFTYFLDLINQDVINSAKEQRKSKAIQELEPFILNKPKNCNDDAQCKEIFGSAKRNYMELINSQK
ncbi:hypothetical protein [Ralstonia flaminis]|jgi:hypothetical protein|nr:hypothetical protein [Ralstonia sp. LMG 18101]